MKRILYVLLLLLLTAKSCFYLDNGEYFVEIESDYNPTVTITSTFDSIDSIMIVDSLLFKYEIMIDTGSLFFADLYLDNFQLYRSGRRTDSIWFQPYFVNYGQSYDISLLAYYKTYTGSLADIMDAEFMLYDTTWTVTFYKEIN